MEVIRCRLGLGKDSTHNRRNSTPVWSSGPGRCQCNLGDRDRKTPRAHLQVFDCSPDNHGVSPAHRR